MTYTTSVLELNPTHLVQRRILHIEDASEKRSAQGNLLMVTADNENYEKSPRVGINLTGVKLKLSQEPDNKRMHGEP